MDAKTPQEDLESLGFTSCLAKPATGKKVRRRRARSYHDRAKRVRVTRRAGRDASERRSGIGENERQPMMAQLAAQ